MKTYYLFLDESKPNGNNLNHLCLGGVIIEKEIYERTIIPSINRIKTSVFGNTQIILHESEIRSAKAPYTNMRVKANRELFWNELKSLFRDNNLTTIGAAIDVSKYRSVYNNTNLNDEYFIVLQIILENFVHFLQNNNAFGFIYIESRTPTDDTNLRNIYYKIVANGTLYLNANAFQNKLLNINFCIKADNNIGVQLADFIPGTLNRNCNGLDPKKPSLISEIMNKLYDGNCGLSQRFGFKIMP